MENKIQFLFLAVHMAACNIIIFTILLLLIVVLNLKTDRKINSSHLL